MMDVRQRGAGNVSSQRHISTENVTVSKITRNNSKSINGKNTRGSARELLPACMFGICLAIVVVALAIFTGILSLTNPSLTAGQQEVSAKQFVRGMNDKQKEGNDPVHPTPYESLQLQNKELRDKLKDLQKMKEAKAAEGAGADATQMTRRISRLETYKERMHEMIQLISKRHLIEKYGLGPHYVEMLLSFDPASNIADSSKAEDTDILLIQMAPIDEMPATVLWFLEQVNATIYDGCSFHRNAGHVVQGGPISNFETKDGGKSVMQKIRSTGLDSVSFQE
jgi:hypothetical protein